MKRLDIIRNKLVHESHAHKEGTKEKRDLAFTSFQRGSALIWDKRPPLQNFSGVRAYRSLTPWPLLFRSLKLKAGFLSGLLPVIMMAFSNHGAKAQFCGRSHTRQMTTAIWAFENGARSQAPYRVWGRIPQGWGPGNIPPSSCPWPFFQEQLGY